MYGGYYVDQGSAGYHNGALYSDPRIAMYMGMGMGMRQMPGDVWWRTWRTLPPEALRDRPRLLLAGSMAGAGLMGDGPRPRVWRNVSRLGGPLRVSGQLAVLRADVRWRHV